MAQKNNTVAIIGPYGTACGVAEYGRFFTEALERAGFTVTLFANRFASGYRSHGLYDDRASFKVFGTGHAPAEERSFNANEVIEQVLATNARVCYINYQDYLYPDKQGLYLALARLASKGVALYCILHDTCLPQNFPFELFRGIVVPSVQLKSARFPTAAKVFIIPQGVPIFPKKDRNELRKDLCLCEPHELMITTFGLGRSDNKEVFKAAAIATQTLNLDAERNPIYTQMIFAKEEDLYKANEDFGGAYSVYLNAGYLEDFKLAAYIQASDAVILNYPPLLGQYATSSALRFALGAGSLIFARQSNWFADVKDAGLFIPFDSVSSLATQLALTFQSDASRRAAEIKLARCSANYCKQNSWDAIVQQHAKMWKAS